MKNNCACSGIRTCLLCEKGCRPRRCYEEENHVQKQTLNQCYKCGNVEIGSTMIVDPEANPMFVCNSSTCTFDRILKPNVGSIVDNDSPTSGNTEFKGLTLIKEFVSEQEEKELVAHIDSSNWAESQSGRLKQVHVKSVITLNVFHQPIYNPILPPLQDYGPKVNFKRQKIKLGSFNGLPCYSKILVERMCTNHKELTNFFPVELCNLDYNPERGSSIDPHFDDCWLWGKRLVTLSLLSHTIFTFTNPLISSIEVCVPLPRRSLVIVEGYSRQEWQHSIQRKHICSRRIAVTFRELSNDFLPGGNQYYTTGKLLTEIAARYDGNPVNFS